MKVTIQSITPPQKKELTYPILMEAIFPNGIDNRKLIVHFTGPTSGMVFYDSKQTYIAFKGSENWINATNEDEWKRFEDKLILEN